MTEKGVGGGGGGKGGGGGRDHPGSRGNTCGGWGVHYLDCGAGDVRTYQTGTLNIHGLLHVNYTWIKL